MPTQTVTLKGTFHPEQEKTYVYLPFDMPESATSVEVHLDYSDRIGSNPLLTGGNTLDLGVFDARGIDFLSAGFRGWTGSERDSFFIAREEATPGYLAGPLMPGKWHVLLGLYKIAPGGCTFEVSVDIGTGPGSPQPGAALVPVGELPSSPPRLQFAPWLRGEMHCHSWHSDGDFSPADVIRIARERGLDFLAITDHNTISSQRELATMTDPGLVLIRGVEVTTFKGHFNVWGIGDWVDFRVQDPEDMAEALRYANERGATTCCNHPKPFGPPWEYEAVEDYRCIEVWNGPWTALNQMAVDFWVDRLAGGRRIPATGGSDWHRQRELEENPPRAPGTPTVWVYVPETPSASAILDAIGQGHVSLSDAPDGPLLELRAGPEFSAMGGDAIMRPADDRLPVRIHCRGGKECKVQIRDQQKLLYEYIVAGPDQTDTIELSVANSLFVRVELRTAEQDMKAMTNPVYLEKKS